LFLDPAHLLHDRGALIQQPQKLQIHRVDAFAASGQSLLRISGQATPPAPDD
jgi:hypothetical protein